MSDQTSNPDEYNGWPNRETWAAMLYLNNEEEWQDALEGAVAAGREDSERFAAKMRAEHGMSDYHYNPRGFVADRIRALVDDFTDPEIVGNEGALLHLRDIGSLWRIDYGAMADNALADFSTV